MRISNHNSRGSVLVWTVLSVTILSLVAAEVLRVVGSKYQNALDTAIWQESLLGAESGIDLAIIELRKSLYPAPNHAWDGWSNTPADGVVSYGLTSIPNAGLAGMPMKVETNVDAPAALKDPTSGWQYYRVRAIGTMDIAGPARVNDNKQDTHLRKLSLSMERFTGDVLQTRAFASDEKPHVSRRIEAIVRPVSQFDQAIMAVGNLNLTDADIVIDSYDSRNPLKSYNGLYPAAPNDKNPDGSVRWQQNGDIATDGQILNAGNAHVYGDVSTNSGTATGVANVTGLQRNDFYSAPIPVTAPTWPSVNPSPMLVSGTATLQGDSTQGSTASRYVLSSVTMSGTDVLTLNGNADGSTSYVNIYITGDVNVTGNAQIIVKPGVKATIYVAGNFVVAGNGVVNSNEHPGDLLFYGITPTDNSSRTFQLGGNSLLSAAVYAPAFDVQINNGGTRGSVYGSFVGKTVTMNGVTDLHYDEALSSGGSIGGYKIVSWFEDNR